MFNKKIKIIVTILFLFIIFIFSFLNLKNKKNISIEKKEYSSSVILINVLDKEDYEDCHIKGSINIPYDTFNLEISKLPKDAEIILYCSNYFCSASHSCAKMLISKGFHDVYVYGGGTAEWFQLYKDFPEDYKIVGSSEASYLNIIVPIPQEYALDLEDQGLFPMKYINKYKVISHKELQKKINNIT